MKQSLLSTCLFCLLFGCGDIASVAFESASLPVDEPIERGIYASLIAGPHVNGVQVVRVELDPHEMRLASYQGVVLFNPSVMKLVEVQVPQTDVHLYNDMGADGGVIRLAGFTAESWGAAVSVRLKFSAARPVESSDIRLQMDVLGTDVGEEIPAESVHQPETIRIEAH